MLNLNPQQKLVIEKALAGHNLVVEARPGSGKTYTGKALALELAKKGKNVLFAAFTNEATNDIKRKVDHHHVTVSTTHRIGLRSLGQRVKIDKHKYKPLAKEMAGKYWGVALEVFNRMRDNLLTEATDEEIDGVVGNVLVSEEAKSTIYATARTLIQESLQSLHVGEIDLGDMIFLPVVLDTATKKYDVAIVDEAQDLTKAQYHLMDKVAEQVVLLGDSFQAIMAWRGAMPDALQIGRELFGAQEVELYTTYRNPRAVVEYVNSVYPEINLRAGNEEEGEVRDGVPLPQLIEGVVGNPSQHMVISRTNASLIPVALHMVKASIPVYLKNEGLKEKIEGAIYTAAYPASCPECGEDMRIVKGPYGHFLGCAAYPSCRAIEKLRDHTPEPMDFIRQGLEQNGELEVSLAKTDHDKQTVRDLYDVSLAVLSEIDDLDKLEGVLDEIFRERGESVMLLTAHTSKGLEREYVHIIEQDKFPHPMAQTETAIQQELNLFFVAMTRASKSLSFVID